MGRGMCHTEGGWPKEVDFSEAQDTSKFRKKLEKDPAFSSAVRSLCVATGKCLEQNSTIDLHEHYFARDEPDQLVENLHLKTVALFKDMAEEPRSLNKVSWGPEGPTKIVGSYSSLRFLRHSEEMSTNSYIWDINERNLPLTSLKSQSPLVCTQYNNKQSDLLLAGCYSGLLNLYDLRKGCLPVSKSTVETSHYDPVYDLSWLQSKTGTEAVTVSSDGRLMIWDVREMQQPRDQVWITDGARENPKRLGAVSVEWMQEAGPSKFLVGCENGIVVSCQNKPKKPLETSSWFGREQGRHFGPVYGVKRNPFHVKFFLTVGDWSARLWMEDLRQPLLMTPYAPSYITACSWSPTRAGVFFLARADGYLSIYDYNYRMNDVSLSQKVTDYSLTSMAVQSQGSFVALGDSNGVLTLLQLCDGLVQAQPNEKNNVGALFDRETKREKNLDTLRKQAKTTPTGGTSNANLAGEHGGDDTHLNNNDHQSRSAIHQIDEKSYQEIESRFFNAVGMEGENLGTTSYLGKKTGE